MLKSEAISDLLRHPRVGTSGNWHQQGEREIHTNIESRDNVNMEEEEEQQQTLREVGVVLCKYHLIFTSKVYQADMYGGHENKPDLPDETYIQNVQYQ